MTGNHVNSFLMVIHMIAQSLAMTAKYASEENIRFGYIMVSAAYFLVSLSISVWFEGVHWVEREAEKL